MIHSYDPMENTIHGYGNVRFLQKGLRTLAIAKKVIPKENYEEMNAKVCQNIFFLLTNIYFMHEIFHTLLIYF